MDIKAMTDHLLKVLKMNGINKTDSVDVFAWLMGSLLFLVEKKHGKITEAEWMALVAEAVARTRKDADV